ncbi:hypothetical protein GSI_01427 [Ganoderma sinense ZZ0214-1]|uniref:Uncharacterized protein n=1 Tax=Ganoderma sinense ZZ0214-1 TaxID=1077348 RepID=A0A2G8SVK3_9APHY|nr:hypothetical protein GSI_01427 [Ganoderma sinense ZZ0214-1]
MVFRPVNGWPAHVPLTNLSDIKGSITPLRLLTDLLHDGMLKLVPAPPDVRRRALHYPESILRSGASSSPNRAFATSSLHTSTSHLWHTDSGLDLRTHIFLPPPRQRNACSTCTPLSPSSLHPFDRSPGLNRVPCDCPVSNPEEKPMLAQKVRALTSNFVLDRPARQTAS